MMAILNAFWSSGADRLGLGCEKTLAAQNSKSAENKKACGQLDQGTWFWYGYRHRFVVIAAIDAASFISAWIHICVCRCAANEKTHAENESWKRCHANN
jgi:hypothetical protein